MDRQAEQAPSYQAPASQVPSFSTVAVWLSIGAAVVTAAIGLLFYDKDAPIPPPSASIMDLSIPQEEPDLPKVLPVPPNTAVSSDGRKPSEGRTYPPVSDNFATSPNRTDGHGEGSSSVAAVGRGIPAHGERGPVASSVGEPSTIPTPQAMSKNRPTGEENAGTTPVKSTKGKKTKGKKAKDKKDKGDKTKEETPPSGRQKGVGKSKKIP